MALHHAFISACLHLPLNNFLQCLLKSLSPSYNWPREAGRVGADCSHDPLYLFLFSFDKYTHHKICHFWVCTVSDILSKWYNYTAIYFQNFFIGPNKSSVIIKPYIPIPPFYQPLVTSNLLSISANLLILVISDNWNPTYLFFLSGLFLLPSHDPEGNMTECKQFHLGTGKTALGSDFHTFHTNWWTHFPHLEKQWEG